MSTTINGTTGINRIEPTAYGLPLSHRNKIINGKMEIAQRGTSFISGVNVYTVDRWTVNYDADGDATITRSTDAPNEFQNSLALTVNTADTAIAAGQYVLLQQRIEGFNARDLIGRTFSLSFRVRSAKTGVHCVAFHNSGADRSYVAEYTISAANTWETKTVTVPGGLITAGTWDWTNGLGLSVFFVLACGATYQTMAGAWQTGNFKATANQVNCLDAVGNIFAITGVQLEVGSVATPFEHRPYGTELALCQRYYERVSLPTLTVGVVGGSGDRFSSGPVAFAVRKRTTPTMTTVSCSNTWAITGNVAVSGTQTTINNFFSTETGFGFQQVRVAGGNNPTNGGGYSLEGSVVVAASAEF